MKDVKKLSANVILGKTTDFFNTYIKPTGKSGVAYTVVGTVTSHRVDSGQYGEFVEFKGEFQFINAATGEVKHAYRAFLPDLANSMVLTAYESSSDKEASRKVMIAFDVVMEPNDKSTTGFDWSIVPRMPKDEKNDPLELLKKSLGIDNTPRLDKPEQPAVAEQQAENQPVAQVEKSASKAKAK